MKRRRIINTLLLLLATLTTMAQQSVWWIDNDYDGRATVTANEQIELEIDISRLTPGAHIFNFRATNSDGSEGALHRHGFVVAPDAAMYDYWIDNRIEEMKTVDVNDFDVDLNGLSAGVHYLNVRPRNLDGTMGALSRRAFQVAPSITAYRYMFALDSLEQTVNVPPTAELTMQEQEFDIPVSNTFYDISAETAFHFGADKVSLIRTDTTQFSMRFLTDEWQQSAPWEVEACIADTITQQLIALRADTMCIAEKGDRGDFRAFRLVAEQEGTYQFSVTQDCDLRLYQQTDSLPFDVRHMTADEVLTLRGEGGQSLYALIYNIARDTLANSSDNIGIRYSAPTAEPYAVLKTDSTTILSQDSTGITYGKTLTFYYDIEKEARSGMSVGPLPDDDNGGAERGWHEKRADITSVVFDESFAMCDTISSTAHWLAGCESLKSITGIENLNTSNVTSMHGMFYKCSSLTSLDVTHFDTQNVKNLKSMFQLCSQLKTIDLSNFNTDNVTNMNFMFAHAAGLNTIYVGDKWSTKSVASSTDMFYNCTSLVGGKGTVYDSGHIDHTYAHIDGGTSNPGYFTDKNAPVIDATFDSNGVLAVGSSTTMTDALESVGGRDKVAKTITAIVWNSSATLANSDLTDISNPNMLIYVPSESQAPQNRDNVVIGNDSTGYTAKNVVLTDVVEGNGNFYCPKEFTAEMISYTHEYRQTTEVGVSRGWETIAMPFNVQTVMHEKQGLIAPFGNSTSKKHFWLRHISTAGQTHSLAQATTIEANMPYLISMPNSDAYPDEYNLAGRVTFSSQNVPVIVTDIFPVHMSSGNGGMLMFVPCFQTQQVHEMVYALNVGEARDGYPEGSVFVANYREIHPFEAYTVHEGNSPAPQFMPIIDFNGSMTGIDASLVNSEEVNSEKWYDLNGRKLQKKPTQKGVYLLNGRKVVMR